VLLPISSGYEDFQITTWDQAPAVSGLGGSFAASANDLSTNIIRNQRIVANSVNTFDFTTNGVVYSVALSLNPGTLVTGQGTETATLSVLADDADGNIIIGSDPYVDANGSPVTITVSKTGETEPGTVVGATPPPSGNVTITGPTTFSDPTNTTTTVSFDGNETQSALFSATTNSSLTIPVSGAALGFTNTTDGGPIGAAGSPTMNALSIANMNGGTGLAGSNYGDAHLYVGDSANNSIEQLNAGATPAVATSWTIPTANADPSGVVIGPDRQIWFAEPGSGKIGAVDPATGHFTEFTQAIGGGIRTAVGPDGNVWVAELNGGVEKVTLAQGPAPAFTTAYTSGFNGAPWGVASDGTNLWVTEANNQIAEVSTSGAVLSQNTIAGASSLREIVLGRDGNLWVTDPDANRVFVVSTSGTLVNSYATTGSPQSLLAANDGAVYFTEANPNLIGRLAPSTGLLSEYSNGVPTAAPAFIAAGSDGQIYYTAQSGSNVYYFAP
jgi:streptogramin lyase